MNTIEKIKTFLTSRRAWAVFAFLGFVAQFLLPYFAEYLGDSFALIKDLPAEEQANVLGEWMLAVSVMVVTVAGMIYLPLRKLLESWGKRPPTMDDAFAVVQAFEDAAAVISEEVEDFKDDGKFNDSNKRVSL